MSGKLIVRDLVKRYGALEAVRGVSFEVAPGEIFGLLGPNGAGKTSIVECVLGLRRPDGGSIHFGDIAALAAPERVKPLIGAALQATALQDRLTPREALRLFGAFYPRRLEPAALLERFSLTAKAEAPFGTLSAGQRQRLALALAFVHEPAALFLDEPTAGLDPQARRDLHGSIRQLRAEGRLVLLTTHDLAEARELCDRVAILDGGRIIAAGRPEELIARSQPAARVELRTARPLDLAALVGLPSAADAKVSGGEARFQTSAVGPAVIELVRLLEAQGNELLDLRVSRPTLEDAFLELTGGALRD